MADNTKTFCKERKEEGLEYVRQLLDVSIADMKHTLGLAKKVLKEIEK